MVNRITSTAHNLSQVEESVKRLARGRKKYFSEGPRLQGALGGRDRVGWDWPVQKWSTWQVMVRLKIEPAVAYSSFGAAFRP